MFKGVFMLIITARPVHELNYSAQSIHFLAQSGPAFLSNSISRPGLLVFGSGRPNLFPTEIPGTLVFISWLVGHNDFCRLIKCYQSLYLLH